MKEPRRVHILLNRDFLHVVDMVVIKLYLGWLIMSESFMYPKLKLSELKLRGVLLETPWSIAGSTMQYCTHINIQQHEYKPLQHI